MALPMTTITCDIHCVTRWSKFDTSWTGVRFSDLVNLFGVTENAKHVIAHCDYGYTTNVPLEDMMHDNVLLAPIFEGEPLEPDHGGPLRTLVPHLYFWKSAKFVRALEFSATDKPGFWEKSGYHNYGDPFKEERYSRRGFF
jgi:DMSO/TMAO reductase YedYZ molybdopterin-dependent catalytic subunit